LAPSIPEKKLYEVFLARQKINKNTRQKFLDTFRQERKKTKGAHKFHTIYEINEQRVCQRHLGILLNMSGRDLTNHEAKKKETPMKRGRKMDMEKNDSLHDFFEGLAKEPSHYCQHKKNFLYIQDHSSISSAFQAYLKKTKNPVRKGTFYAFYQNQIATQNIFIKKLKKDVCDLCLSLCEQKKYASNAEKKVIQDKIDSHQQLASAEEILQQGFNKIAHHISTDQTSNKALSILRLDVDPASNLAYPKFAEEQVLEKKKKGWIKQYSYVIVFFLTRKANNGIQMSKS